MPAAPDLLRLLADARTIAVVGLSARPHRTSHRIARYLQDSGYRVVPVNPHYDAVHGEPCYPDLASIPYGVEVDLINVFRAPRHTAGVVREAAAFAAERECRPAIWTQLGVSTPEAERLAAEAGLPYVANRCILVEHARLF